jgi:hypothetical protein
MAISTAEANSIYNAQFRQTNWTAPTTLYLSLHTAAPGATGANEVADATYARQVFTTAMGAPTAGAGANTSVVEYPAATTGFTATHGGVWTAVSGGTYLRDVDISPDKVVGAGEILRLAVGAITYSVTSA